MDLRKNPEAAHMMAMSRILTSPSRPTATYRLETFSLTPKYAELMV